MNGRRAIGMSLGLAVTVGLGGCLSLEGRLGEQTARVAAGDYAGAYQTAAAEAAAGGVDGTFWSAEAGALALWEGKPQAAIPHLDAADNGFNDVARRRYGASAADTAKAVAVSDTLLPYAPEGLDRVFANVYKALAYGVAGDPAGMRVELNRARQRQYEWFYRCSEAIAEADAEADLDATGRRAVREAVAREGVAPPARLDAAVARAVTAGEGARAVRAFGALRGFGNAYAAHLAGVTRWCAGDSSLNDLAMAAALAPGNAAAQADLEAERAGRTPRGRVWVYVEDGLAPRRVSNAFTVPYPSLAAHGEAFGTLSFDVPRLEDRPAAARAYAVNGVALSPLTDVRALAHDQFDRAWPGILARQVARTLLRVAAHEGGQAALRASADNALGPLVLSAVMGLFDVATNVADLRCADLLPRTVWMGALARPEDGRLTLTPAGGRSLSLTLRPRGNALVWVRRPTAAGPATVLVIDLDRKEKTP